MENAVEYHRDIYSGMVAEELGKAGYFGEVYTLYGYLLWTEAEERLCYATSEMCCAQGYIRHWRQGYELSPYLSESVRVAVGADAVEEERKLQIILQQKLRSRYGSVIHGQIDNDRSQVDQKHVFAILEEHWRSSSVEVQQTYAPIFAGMVRQLINKGYLNKEKAGSFLDTLSEAQDKTFADDEVIQEWAGYAWLDEAGIYQYYSNAYLPQTLQKWLAMREDGRQVSGILTKRCSRRQPLAIYREQWQKLLMKIFDERYWQMRQSLQRACKSIF